MPAVRVETRTSDVRVETPFYGLTFQRRGGGTLRTLTFSASGRTLAVRQDDALFAEKQGERGAWKLVGDTTPDISVVASGPVRTVLEVRTRFRQVGRAEGILVAYRYTFWNTIPLIGITVRLPSQSIPEPISTFTLFHYVFDVGHPFTGWATGGPQATGILSGSGRRIVPSAGTAAQPWIAISGPEGAFGLSGTGLGPLYDGKANTQLSGPALRPWQGGAWAGEPFEWGGYLYVGGSGEVSPAMEAVGSLTVRLAGQTAASVERMQRSMQGLAAQAARATGSAAAAAKSLALAATMINRAAQERLATGRDLSSARLLSAWAVDVAALASRVLNMGAAPPPVPILLQREGFAAAANEYIGLLFRTTSAATDLISIFHRNGDGFIRAGEAPRPLWEVRMRDVTGKTFVGTSIMAGPARMTVDRTGGVMRTTWQWGSGTSAGGLARPAVRATVTMAAAEPLTRWRIAADSASPLLTVSEIAFPIIGGLGKTTSPAGPDFVALPLKSGIIVPNPAAGPAAELEYPGNAPIQLVSYWVGGTGLYLATYDGQGYLKRYRVAPSMPGTFEYRVVTIVPSGSRAVALPFDGVVGVFDGDWYDAAKLYRKWALQQRWVPKRPLSTNTDIPQWWRETNIVFRPSGDPREIVPAMQALHDYFGMPAIVNWYFWNEAKDLYDNSPQMTPRPGFREAAATLRRQQMPVVSFMPFLIWDTRSQSWVAERGEQAAVRDARGNIVLKRYGAPGLLLAAMCPVTAQWQRKVIDTLTAILDAGDVGGVYLDLAGSSVSAPCYADSHGHTPGGGAYYVDALRALLNRVRETARRRNPGFIMLSEGAAEPFLDLIDAYLMYHTTLADLTPYNVPVFQAIYGDYIRPYGVKSIGSRPHPVDALQGAQAFTFGARIGRIFDDSLLTDQPEYAGYLRQLARYRQAGFAYLGTGEMLRPPRIEYVSAPSAGLVEKREAIQTSAWRAPDRSVGFFFTNAMVGLPPVRLRFRLVPADYGIPANGSYTLYTLTPDGLRKVTPITGPVDRTELLPSLGILAYVARPNR